MKIVIEVSLVKITAGDSDVCPVRFLTLSQQVYYEVEAANTLKEFRRSASLVSEQPDKTPVAQTCLAIDFCNGLCISRLPEFAQGISNRRVSVSVVQFSQQSFGHQASSFVSGVCFQQLHLEGCSRAAPQIVERNKLIGEFSGRGIKKGKPATRFEMNGHQALRTSSVNNDMFGPHAGKQSFVEAVLVEGQHQIHRARRQHPLPLVALNEILKHPDGVHVSGQRRFGYRMETETG